MRRVLLVTAGVLAVACAATQRAGGARRDTPPARVGPSAPAPDEKRIAFDLDHDGKPDVWKYARVAPGGKETVAREEKDLNGDGKIDTWEVRAPDGTLEKVEYDLDFDGRPDVALFFEREELVRKEDALGFDGVPHGWSFYEHGKLVRKERDTDGDGKVDTWEYWQGGDLDRVGIDLDGDGKPDRWEERRTAKSAAAPASGPAAAMPSSAPASGQK